MPKTKKLTLLDRAKMDLYTAKVMREKVSVDDALIDICAYHCQQCVEKTAKYMIVLQGDDYATDHRKDHYLPDLADGEIKDLIEGIAIDIDQWAAFIRYRSTILSSKSEVDSIIILCDKLIELAEAATPLPTRVSDNKTAEIFKKP